MGPSYSMPHTPEDFLASVDDVSESSVQTPSNTDISNMELGEPSNMDSDDLEPSLQEELSSDLLNDVEALLTPNRMDTELTWL
jgi:protein yorkie